MSNWWTALAAMLMNSLFSYHFLWLQRLLQSSSSPWALHCSFSGLHNSVHLDVVRTEFTHNRFSLLLQKHSCLYPSYSWHICNKEMVVSITQLRGDLQISFIMIIFIIMCFFSKNTLIKHTVWSTSRKHFSKRESTHISDYWICVYMIIHS